MHSLSTLQFDPSSKLDLPRITTNLAGLGSPDLESASLWSRFNFDGDVDFSHLATSLSPIFTDTQEWDH